MATNVINDGNTITNVVEATLAGSSGSNVVIKNDGTITVAEYISSTLTNLLQVITGTGLKLGAVGRLTEVIGNMTVDGTTTITGGLVGNISATSITTTGATTSGTVASTGLITGSAITTTGAATVSRINTVLGGLSRIVFGSTGSITGSGGTVTVTHTLGATPDIVLLVPISAPALTQSYSVSSIGATTFLITNGSVSAVSLSWVALKF